MTWESGACEPGLEGTPLDRRTWSEMDADELRALGRRFEDLLDQLRAGQAAQRGDELAARRARPHWCQPCAFCADSGDCHSCPDCAAMMRVPIQEAERRQARRKRERGWTEVWVD